MPPRKKARTPKPKTEIQKLREKVKAELKHWNREAKSLGVRKKIKR